MNQIPDGPEPNDEDSHALNVNIRNDSCRSIPISLTTWLEFFAGYPPGKKANER